MRKIETQMNAAIANSTNWQSGNTSVHFNEEESISIVRLHGNKIAEIGEGFIRLFDGGWQTNTTKSRLNAILEANGADGDKVFQKNFDWFVQLDTRQGLTVVPFFSSMRLGWLWQFSIILSSTSSPTDHENPPSCYYRCPTV